MIEKLYEMALSRSDAIEYCMSMGEKFIEHFHKVYQDYKGENSSHWQGEMSGWYKSVRRVKLKTSKKSLLDGSLRDWFFTAGGNTEDDLKDENENADYDRFCTYLLAHPEESVSEAFEHLFKDKESKS